jgi:hypothetical protein
MGNSESTDKIDLKTTNCISYVIINSFDIIDIIASKTNNKLFEIRSPLAIKCSIEEDTLYITSTDLKLQRYFCGSFEDTQSTDYKTKWIIEGQAQIVSIMQIGNFKQYHIDKVLFCDLTKILNNQAKSK